MTILDLNFEYFDLGSTFPALAKRNFNDQSYKFFFDLNLLAEEPFLILRVKPSGERSYIFQNKLIAGVEQVINKSIKILPVFIKILHKETGFDEFKKITDPEKPNEIIFLSKVRDLV